MGRSGCCDHAKHATEEFNVIYLSHPSILFALFIYLSTFEFIFLLRREKKTVL